MMLWTHSIVECLNSQTGISTELEKNIPLEYGQDGAGMVESRDGWPEERPDFK